MSPSISARRGISTALTVLAALGLLIVGFAGSAQAADKTSGKVTFNVTSGKAGKVTAVNPAKVAKRFGKGAKVTSNAKNGQFISKSKVNLKAAGGIRFASGKRKVVVRGLEVSVFAKRAVVRGKLKGKKINVFNVTGKANIDTVNRTARLNGAKLALTSKAAKQIRKSLKLKKAPRGKIGSFTLNLKVTSDTPVDPCVENPDGEGCPITDPYLEQCGVEAVAKVPGSITPAGPLPEFTNLTGTTGPANLSWGFKSSYRNYVVNLAGGSIHVANGASTTGTAPVYSGFEFPATGFRYTDNGTPANLADDKAVLDGSGTAIFCNPQHGFRVALSNPTLVVDGANSRIDADVDANLSGSWVPTQRVTVANLDLTGKVSRTADGAGSKVNWTDVPAALTEAGSQAFCGVGELDKCSYLYPAGTALDTVSLSVSTDVEVDQYQAQCGVAVSSKVEDARTPATALPALSGSLPTTSPTTISWGYRTSFRGYVYGSMSPSGKGAQALQALDGASKTVPMNPTSGFNFPVASGMYAANDGVDTTDDQAVISGTGTALFCNSEHGFWVSISDPIVVIDGENSRIVADISSNESGVWKTTQKLDFADLDLTGITPIYNKSGSEVTWGAVPAKLSAIAGPFGNVAAGTDLDPITVSVKTAYDTGEGDAAAWDALATYVQTNLPYPNSDPTQGGCEVGVPDGGVPANPDATSRTIDEHRSYGGTTSSWFENPSRPAVVPAVTGTETTGGGIDWGFRGSLRGSVNGTGEFNLFGGTTASHTPFYGHGAAGALTPVNPPRVPAGEMGNVAGRNFTWPHDSGVYNANGAGDADDQLILQGEGTVAFCQTQSAQRYSITFSNPRVIIDGANSRITADVTTRYRLSWVRATVDLASIDPTFAGSSVGTTGVGSGTLTKTFAFPDGGAIKLTADGAKLAGLISPGQYVEGANLDGATIRASFPE